MFFSWLLSVPGLLEGNIVSWIQALLFGVDIQNMAILSLEFIERPIKKGKSDRAERCTLQ